MAASAYRSRSSRAGYSLRNRIGNVLGLTVALGLDVVFAIEAVGVSLEVGGAQVDVASTVLVS